MRLRRALYRSGLLHSEHPGRPTIVVGNVIAGGAGKTPVVMALVEHLQARGLQPGVISRGYGRSTSDCREVLADSPASEVGDEPALIARHCGVPVFVDRQRSTAARALLARHPGTDVIVCDDGLQHLALQRDLEVCVFNDQGVGNGFLLPAGPLREPWPRAVDWVLHPDSAAAPAGPAPTFALRRGLAEHAARADGSRIPLQSLQGRPVHALAAIARPEDFFGMLRQRGLDLARTTALPDHHDFTGWGEGKEGSGGRLPLLCTAKDAVKLWPLRPDALAVPLEVRVDPAFFTALDARLATLVAPVSLSSPPARPPVA
ncbi:tetraacyldisaccharide 4'-kinase [Acidovorax soli]|uniref:Tetraacyldisaccharide 4'-kinase n=1 Tax=Acidovorax soli TaxID=592050 RepID=A0A7X0PAS0_9BURK|nr:tetraacyldisaccharide 4'-kinase [Acidovorax soli]